MAAWRVLGALTGKKERLLKYSRLHMLLELGALGGVFWADRANKNTKNHGTQLSYIAGLSGALTSLVMNGAVHYGMAEM